MYLFIFGGLTQRHSTKPWLYWLPTTLNLPDLRHVCQRISKKRQCMPQNDLHTFTQSTQVQFQVPDVASIPLRTLLREKHWWELTCWIVWTPWTTCISNEKHINKKVEECLENGALGCLMQRWWIVSFKIRHLGWRSYFTIIFVHICIITCCVRRSVWDVLQSEAGKWTNSTPPPLFFLNPSRGVFELLPSNRGKITLRPLIMQHSLHPSFPTIINVSNLSVNFPEVHPFTFIGTTECWNTTSWKKSHSTRY